MARRIDFFFSLLVPFNPKTMLADCSEIEEGLDNAISELMVTVVVSSSDGAKTDAIIDVEMISGDLDQEEITVQNQLGRVIKKMDRKDQIFLKFAALEASSLRINSEDCDVGELSKALKSVK